MTPFLLGAVIAAVLILVGIFILVWREF